MRSIAKQRSTYLKEIGITNQRKAKATERLIAAGRIGDGDSVAKDKVAKELREALADTATYLSILKILNDVEKMVVDEKEGWDWKTGLRE